MAKTKFFHITDGEIDDGPTELNLIKEDLAQLKGLGWLPEIITGYEPFDSETQVREGPVYVVNADDVSTVYTVRAKTQAEIDAEKDNLAAIIMAEPGVVALAKALNNGTFVPGSNYTNPQMKDIIRGVL